MRPQHPHLVDALEPERHQRAQHAGERDESREQAQHLRDRERAVEDDERGLAEGPVVADEHVRRAGRPPEPLDQRGDGRVGRRAEGQPRDAAIVPEALVRAPAQRDHALIGRVVVEHPRDVERALAAVGAEPKRRPDTQAAAVGVRLGHDHGAARLERRPHRGGGAAREAEREVSRGRNAQDDQAGRPRRRLDGHGPVRADASHPGNCREPRDERGGQGRRRAPADRARRRHVDVGLERGLEPALHGRAEAFDHDADGQGRRDRDHQRRRRDRGAAQRPHDVARGHPAEHAEEPARQRRERHHQDDHRARREAGEPEHEDEERHVASHEAPARDGEEPRPCEQQADAGEEEARNGAARARLDRGPAQHGPGRRRRRLHGRRKRGQHRRPEAEGRALDEDPGRDRQVPDREDEVEVVDRPRHELGEPAGEDDPGRQPRQAPRHADRERLGQDQPEDLPPGHPERAEQPDRRPSLHDREGHRVVDEERADEQREQTQRGEVQAEGPQHLLDRLGARRGSDHLGPGREEALDTREDRVPRGAVRDDEVDPAQPAAQVEQLLRARDVGEQEALQRLPAERVGGLEESSDGHRPPRAADSQAEARAGREPEGPGGRGGE